MTGGTYVSVTAGRWSLQRRRRSDAVLLDMRWTAEMAGPVDLLRVARWALNEVRAKNLEGLKAATE
jgi:hypothetical protein